MKRAFILLFTGILMLNSNIFSQTTKDVLIQDLKFIEFTNKNYELSIDLLNSFTLDERNQINDIIEQKKLENLSEEEQFVVINDLFNFNDIEKFKSFYTMYSSFNPYLNDTYGIIPGEIMESAYNDIIALQPRAIDCGWRYNLCCAAVFVESSGLFLACEGATAGIGTPLCLAGAIIWQTNSIGDCADKYCK